MLKQYLHTQNNLNVKKIQVRFLPFLMVLIGFSAQAQWTAVGSDSGISAGGAGHLQLRSDASGNYYVGYYDTSVSKGSVQKYNGTSWSYLGGTAGITSSYALYTKLAVKDAQNIYYSNQGSGMEVRKFDGSSWASLSTPITSTVNYQSIEVGANGVVYIGATTAEGTVMRYVNGNWEQLGTAGFAAGVAAYIDMVVGTNGKIYVSFINAGYVHVYQNDLSASSVQPWTAVGNLPNVAAAANSENYNSSIAIDANNNVYLSYVSTAASGQKLNVKKFDGSTWSPLGNENFSPGRTQHNSIAVTPSGTAYVASSNWEGSGSDSSYLRNYVMKYDAVTASWVQVYTNSATQSYFVSSGTATNNSLIIDGAGNLVLAYSDGGLDKLVVKKIATTENIDYCAITFPSGAEPISNVTFAGIDNDSSPVIAAGLPAYEDFTTVGTAQVNQGSTYTIAVSAFNPANTTANFANHIVAFMDWNHNGSFSDTGEAYYLGYTQGNATVTSLTAAIAVPANALLGATTMRIVKKYYTSLTAPTISPCNTTGYGQAEDYSLFVSVAGVVAVENVAISIQGNTTAAITTANGTLQLVATVTPAESDQNVVWSIAAGTAATINANGTVTATANGIVTIKLTSATNSSVSTTIDIVITNQQSATPEIITTPVVITAGFNYDIIANGTGESSISSEVGFDEQNSRALVSKDFKATANSPFPVNGLPINGLIASVNTAGINFQLANYTGPNALFLTPSYVTTSVNNQNSGTLAFTAQNVQKVYILSGAAGGGSANLNYTAVINFTDGTSQSALLTATDWYSGTGFAIKGIGRVNRSNNNLEGDADNPRLYESAISINPENLEKSITGIDFSFDGDSGAEYGNEIRLSVLAISVTATPAPAPSTECVFTTLSLAGFNADVVAEGTGGNADTKTTAIVDAANVYYAKDFVPLAPHNSGASAVAFGGGLPNNGLLSSGTTAGLNFQIADYATPNALLLRNSLTNTGTLNLVTPKKAKKIYLAAVSAEGTNNVTVTVNFTDATVQTFTVQAKDWWQNTAVSNLVSSAVGRVSRGASWAPLNQFGELSQTGVYQNELLLDDANFQKTISSIGFTKQNSANNATTTAILAVSICETQTLGMGEVVSDNSITLYPNPTSGIVNIATEEVVKEINIYNMIGQQIWKGKEKQLDLSSIEQGVYLIHIQFENGKTAIQKVIKR